MSETFEIKPFPPNRKNEDLFEVCGNCGQRRGTHYMSGNGDPLQCKRGEPLTFKPTGTYFHEVSSPPPAPTHAGEQDNKPNVFALARGPLEFSIYRNGVFYCQFKSIEEIKAVDIVFALNEIQHLRTQLADLRQKLGESEAIGYINERDELLRKVNQYKAKAAWVDKWGPIVSSPDFTPAQLIKARSELRAILQKGKQV